MTAAPAIRILLCDDSTELRSVVRGVLERDGDLVVVGEAEDGPASVMLAARELPDVIVLDLTMPGLGLDSLVPAVRRSAPDAALVLFSGVASAVTDRLVDRGRRLVHVPKTAPPGQLVDVVRALARA